MGGRPTWSDCDEAGNYNMPNMLSPRDLVSRPDHMDETVRDILNCTMVNVTNLGDYVLLPLHGTSPSAVRANMNKNTVSDR